jgi:type I restriction enzyme, R subunit
MSQFAFLRAEFSDAHEHAAKAESLAHADPRAPCFYARFALEVIVKWLYRNEASLRDPYETTLSARIHEPSFQQLVGPDLVAKARIVKDLGNNAVHDARAVPFAQAATSLRELFHIAYWLARTYGRASKPDAGIVFAAEALPRTSSIPSSSLRQLQEIAKRFAETVAARDEAEKRLLAVESSRAQLEGELAEARAECSGRRGDPEQGPPYLAPGSPGRFATRDDGCRPNASPRNGEAGSGAAGGLAPRS